MKITDLRFGSVVYSATAKVTIDETFMASLLQNKDLLKLLHGIPLDEDNLPLLGFTWEYDVYWKHPLLPCWEISNCGSGFLSNGQRYYNGWQIYDGGDYRLRIVKYFHEMQDVLRGMVDVANLNKDDAKHLNKYML